MILFVKGKHSNNEKWVWGRKQERERKITEDKSLTVRKIDTNIK